MPDKKPLVPAVSMSNTKKEMLDAYEKIVEQLEEKREAELKPVEKIEEKKSKEMTSIADSISTEEIVRKTAELKHEFGLTLAKLSEKLESEVENYDTIKTAVENKRNELQDIFEIQKEATSLAALIEAQRQKRQEFEEEMAARKAELESEIQSVKEEWEWTEKQRELEVKESETAELKQRKREKEDFEYDFQRAKQQTKDAFEAEKAAWEREWNNSKEAKEKEFAEREQAIAQSEAELKELREKVENFPEELNKAVEKAVKEATERIQLDAKHKDQLNLNKFEGENNVLTIRIESLEKTIKEQNQHIDKLSTQLEKSYSQVQDIAVKAVEGSSGQRNLANISEMLKEQNRKSASGQGSNQ